MADVAAVYTLTANGGTISFNDGDLKDGTDKYWITSITGLDGNSIRAPIDNVPFGDGAILHSFWKGPRHIVFEGVFITESVGFPSFGDACLEAQNAMEDDLLACLESMLRADGTLSWTPHGGSARTLTVRHDVSCEFTEIENYALKQFTFGLVAGNPDW